MSKFSAGRYRGVVDLRKRKPGEHSRTSRTPMRPLVFESERRIPLRVRRRRNRLLFLGITLASICIAAVGAHYLSYLPQFSIQRIDVRGTNDIQPELVQSFVETKLFGGPRDFLSPSNIFVYHGTQLEREIASFFPRVRSAAISRPSLFSTDLIVTIYEREPFAKWTPGTPGAAYEMDDSGFIFAVEQDPASITYKSPVIFEGYFSATSTVVAKTYLAGRFTAIRSLLERLGQSGFAPTVFIAQSDQDFEIQLSRGYSIKASFGASAEDLIKNLELVLSSDVLRDKESKLEYIDLRFGNRVYYKFKVAEQQATPTAR